MMIRKYLKLAIVSLIVLVTSSETALASTGCKKMAFVKPLPHSVNEIAIAEWNMFIRNIHGDHQAAIDDPANNQEILNYLSSKEEKSTFHRSLSALAQYHGCFGVTKDRASAVDKLKLTADEGEPLSIIYLSVQPEYQTDKKTLRRWSKILKRKKSSPLIESVYYNIQIIELWKDITDKASTGIGSTFNGGISPFNEEISPLFNPKGFKKYKKSIATFCDLSSDAYKVWRQNGVALGAFSACNSNPHGRNNKYEAYKFQVASLAIGMNVPEAQLDRLGYALGNSETVKTSYEQGFQYAGVSLTQPDIEYLNHHLSRLQNIANQNMTRNKTIYRNRNSDVRQRTKTSRETIKKTGFFSHDTKDGFTKICYYNVLGDTKALNKSATDICPLTHKF